MTALALEQDTTPDAVIEVSDSAITLVAPAEATVVDATARFPFPRPPRVPRELLQPPSSRVLPQCTAARCSVFLDKWEQYGLDTGECRAHHVERQIRRIAPEHESRAAEREARQSAVTMPAIKMPRAEAG